jgi:hypothetical protein
MQSYLSKDGTLKIEKKEEKPSITPKKVEAGMFFCIWDKELKKLSCKEQYKKFRSKIFLLEDGYLLRIIEGNTIILRPYKTIEEVHAFVRENKFVNYQIFEEVDLNDRRKKL